jgi:carbonic anhydrase
MSATDDLLQNNQSYAAGFSKADLTAPPLRKVTILTCMDARVDPARILGLEEGDAHVLRNAGGVVTEDTIRSFSISQHLLGTEEILLMHHTDCGMAKLSDEEIAEILEEHAGERPQWRALAFSDIEQSVRDSMKRVQESPFIPHRNVRGFVYDVHSGQVREVT